MNGKGSSPRNCFSKSFKENYDDIDWGKLKISCRICNKKENQNQFAILNIEKKTGVCKNCNDYSSPLDYK